ncbi:MAG: hypothetical protein ACREHG_02760 [Candidatus Saccharimonadales bacterium]
MQKGKKIKAAPAQLPTAEAAITTQKLSTENGVHVGCGLTQQPDPTQFGRPMPDDEVPLHPELTGGITAPLNLPPSPTPLSCCNLSPNDNTSAKPSHEVLLLPGLAGSMSAPLNPLSSPTPSSKHDDSLNGDTSPKPHIIKFRHAFYYNKGGADGKSVPSSDNELDDESLGEDQPSSPLPSRQESPAEAIRAIFDPDGNWSDHWGQEDPSDLEDNGKANNGDFNLIDDLHPEDQQQFIASHEDGKDSSSSSDDDDDSDDEGGQSDDEDERKNSKSTNRPGPISKPILKKIRTIYEEAMEMMMEISGKSAKVVLEAVAPVPTKFRRNTSAWNAFQAWYCSEHPCLKEGKQLFCSL